MKIFVHLKDWLQERFIARLVLANEVEKRALRELDFLERREKSPYAIEACAAIAREGELHSLCEWAETWRFLLAFYFGMTIEEAKSYDQAFLTGTGCSCQIPQLERRIRFKRLVV